MTSRVIAACAALALAGAVTACGDDDDASSHTGSTQKVFTIGVAEYADIPPILDAVEGLKSALAARGYKEGDRVRYVVKNAQGQTNNASLVARQLVGEKPDLIYALGTPLIIALAQQTKSIPILFGAMTDPLGAKVIQSAGHPGTNVSGTSDFVPASVYIDLFKKVVPNVKRVGVLANPAEPNSQAAIAGLKTEAAKHDIELRVAAVANTAAIVPALNSLRGNIDILTFPGDNTIGSALETVVRTATRMGMPVIANTTEVADEGGLIGVGSDYGALGEINGGQAADVLAGKKKVQDMPVYFPTLEGVAINVNKRVAKQLGIPSDRLPDGSAVGE